MVKFEKMKVEFELKEERNVIFGRNLRSPHSKKAIEPILWSFFLLKRVEVTLPLSELIVLRESF